jgi:hypothetical protein
MEVNGVVAGKEFVGESVELVVSCEWCNITYKRVGKSGWS